MNILDAVYRTFRQFKGGATVIVTRMGIRSVSALNSKVNPNIETYYLTLMDSSRMMVITSNYLIIKSLFLK